MGIPNRKSWISHGQYIIILVLALASAQVSENSGFVESVEYIASDLWHQLAGEQHSPSHVALVEIDEKSLNAYRDEPLVFWTPQVAKAASVLREVGASVIGLDLMFSISIEQWLRKYNVTDSPSNYDLDFRREIASGKLVMVTSIYETADGQDQYLLPANEYLLVVPDFDMTSYIGIADLTPDKDGAVRQYKMVHELNLSEGMRQGRIPLFSLAPLLAIKSGGYDVNDSKWDIGNKIIHNDSELHVINYAGPPGTIPRISLADLLEPDALNNTDIKALRGKVVIIGGNYHGMNDSHITPYSRSYFGSEGVYMTGPEIQANIVESIISDRTIEKMPTSGLVLYHAVILVIALILLRMSQPLFAGLYFIVLVTLTLVVSYLAFINHLIIPVASTIIGLSVLLLGIFVIKLYVEKRSRNYITETFGRYVSSSVVDEIIASGEKPALGGKRQEVTVLFSDIRNFTSISERLDAVDVVEMLNNYFEDICQVVMSEGGTIDKFIGDAIMVHFGTPVYYADHAERALRTAIRMRQHAEKYRDTFKARHPEKDLPEFAIGIGIHSGSAVIGNIGSSQRLEYTAIGDAVNTASRIEGQTKEFGCTILASENTLDLVSSTVITGQSASVSVKGKEEPVKLYEIIELK